MIYEIGVPKFELVPADDTQYLGIITAMRVVWNVIRALLSVLSNTFSFVKIDFERIADEFISRKARKVFLMFFVVNAFV